MKFSESTLAVLKNFSSINQSIIMKPGNVLKTINAAKTVVAIATIEDEIPAEAGIYELARFLSVYSLYKNPTVEFGTKYFEITEGRRRTTYVYCTPEMAIAPPDKKLDIPVVDVEVPVEWADLQSVLKASNVLQLPEIAFVGEDGKIFLRAIDSSNPSADTFGVEIGETNDTFTLVLKTENLKLMAQDYNVSITQKGISCFTGENIKYFVAIEKNSSVYKKGE